jgi:hypothetical protein
MNEQRFQDLHTALIHEGVAGRHAHRAVRELERRFQQFVAEAQARGASVDSARSEAHRLLGTDQSIVDRIASQPGLRAWSCRWPGLTFTITPIVLYIALVVVTIMAIPALGEWAGRHLPGIHLTTDSADRLSVLARVFVLWCMPVLLAAFFAYLAYRHRLALRWPITSIILLSALAALGDFSLVLHTPGRTGTLSAGIGANLHTLPTQFVRGLIVALLVLVPLLLATRSTTRGPPMASGR